MVLSSAWVWAHLFFILYVGKALFKLVLLFNNLHLGWHVTLENWVSSNLQCWFKILTNWLSVSTATFLAEVLIATHLVYCNNLLIGLLPPISTL